MPTNAQINNPNYVEIYKFYLTNNEGATIDISSIVESVFIYEDIFKPSITCEIFITDANNLLNVAPIIGEEKIDIQFSTIGSDGNLLSDLYQKTFNVMSIGNIIMHENHAKTYTLFLTTSTFYTNVKKKVSKSYSGSYSDMASSIMDDIGLSLNNVEDSLGDDKSFIVPNIRPFEAISLLTTKAISKNDSIASDYVFYEDKDGYNFVTLNSLKSQDISNQFNYKQKSIAGSLDVFSKSDIEEMSIFKYKDQLENYENGAYASTQHIIDFNNKIYHKATYDYEDHFSEMVSLGNGYLTSINADVDTNSSAQYIKYEQLSLVDYDTSINTARNIQRIGSMNIIDDIGLRITVSGNVLQKVGTVVEVTYPSIIDRVYQYDDLIFSGKWLITQIKHKLTSKYGYQMILHLSKDSYATGVSRD